MRKFLIFAAAILLILIGLWASLVLYFDEQRIKQLAIDHVRAETGRELIIDGALDLSVFPNLALRAEQVRLSGPAASTSPDLFTADQLSLSLRLLPLLRGEIETGDIALSGAEIRLHTDLDGNTTLDGLSSAPVSASDTAANPPGSDRPALSTGEIVLLDIQLLVSDERTAQLQRFLIDRLQVDAFAFGRPVAFELNTEQLNRSTSIRNLQVKGQLIIPAGNTPIRIDKFSLSGLANAVELGLKGVIELEATPMIQARFEQGALMLNDQRFALAFSYIQSRPARIDASLVGDRMDLDQLLEDLEPQLSTKADQATSPLLVLRTLDLDATVALDALLFSEFNLSNLEAELTSRAGVVTLDPFNANLDGGRISMTATIDLNPTPAIVQLSPQMEVSALDQALAPWSIGQYVRGAGKLQLQLTAAGLSPEAVLDSLSGTGQYDLRDGALIGIDFGGMVEGLANRNVAEALRGGLGGTTEFDHLQGLLDIERGKLRFPEFDLHNERLGLQGEILVGIANGSLDGELRLNSPRLNTIPLALSGFLSRPQITPDLSAALREAAGRRVLELLQGRQEETTPEPEDKQNDDGNDG